MNDTREIPESERHVIEKFGHHIVENPDSEFARIKRQVAAGNDEPIRADRCNGASVCEASVHVARRRHPEAIDMRQGQTG